MHTHHSDSIAYRIGTLCLLFTAMWIASPAHAETVASVESPDKTLKVELDLSGEGRLAYRVARNGQPLIGDSRLGFILRNGRQLLRGIVLVICSVVGAAAVLKKSRAYKVA